MYKGEGGGEAMTAATKTVMAKAGFIEASERGTRPRLIVAISGLEKQGKTHFGLSTPGPIAMFSTDIGEEGVVSKFAGKEVYIMDIDYGGEEGGQAAAQEEFARFKKAYLAMLRGNSVRTILFDTATEIWETLRMARFGALTQIMPYMYGPVNKEYRDLIREAYNWDKNLILLHKMKSEYVNDKRTGEYVRSGFNDTGFLVQVNAQVWRYEPSEGGEFVFSVKDCRQEPDLAGFDLEGEMCNFPSLAAMVLPEVDMGEWE